MEERRFAEERGPYQEGVPAITVIVDGAGVSAPISILS